VSDPSKRYAIAVGASLAAGTLIMFWSLHLALSSIQLTA
jgi:hypothetical protein